MKISSFLLLLPIVAIASPVPVAKPDPEAEAEALNILGIKLPIPISLPPILGGILGGTKPTATTTAPVTLPTAQITSTLTALLKRLGVPAADIPTLVNAITTLLSTGGVVPKGLLNNFLNLSTATLNPDNLNQIGSSLNQILQGVLPGPATTNLVNTVINTLKGLLGSPVTTPPASSPTPTPGVVPGVVSLLNNVLALLGRIDPTTSNVGLLTSQLGAVAGAVQDVVNYIVKNGTGGVSAATLTALLQQIFTTVSQLLARIPVKNQALLLGVVRTLLARLAALVTGVASVPGITQSLLNTLTGLLNTALANTGPLGALLTNLINGLHGLVTNGAKNGLSALLSSLGLGGIL